MLKFRHLLIVITAFIGVGFLLPSNSVQPAYATSNGGGPIVLDGMDPVCHSGWESTGQYIAKVLSKLYSGATNSNNGHIAIVGSNGTTTSCGAAWATQLSTQFLAGFTTPPQVDFYTTDAEISTFFATTVSTSPPAILWIPDNWSRSYTIEAIFTTNAEKIADFVNSGGGLFANMNSYGWLTSLLPGAIFNNGGCNGGPEATGTGIADFGLTNTLVAACWHGYFTGNVGSLKTLVDYPYPEETDTRKAVSIGGGDVSLPSSFTLSISPENPTAGTPLTITATAQTLAGVPQAGVVVSMTVSSGPDAGQTFTATTDSNGIATITINTSSTGTNVYTAVATVNGISKTVSKTVEWAVAPTTTLGATTTTAEVPTTVIDAPETTIGTTTTTEVLITPIVETTVAAPTMEHDHSAHSHGTVPETIPSITDNSIISLPVTGSDSDSSGIMAFGILASGFAIYLLAKKNK